MSAFGKITYQDNRWRIVCEPHVRTKLKRLFPQVDQRAGDFVLLSDTEENCRDLLWFTHRYPMEVEDLARLERGASHHVERESIVAELLEHRRPPEAFELAIPARDYQTQAATLAEVVRGLLVADDVGLGKTVTSICPMARPENLPVLVVTLSHLPKQWRDELADFAPELKVHILKSGQPYDLIPKRRGKQATLFDSPSPRLPDVIISNYHKLRGWSETLAGVVRYVVFDEIQELRHPDSAKYAAATHIAHHAQLTMALSATPIFNYGVEFFNVIEVLRPGALGTREEFLREWCDGTDRVKDTKAFGEYLRREGLMIRRTRKDVGREMPKASTIPYTIDCDTKILDGVKSRAVELANLILSTQPTARGAKFHASEEFNVLMRQATGIAKAVYVAAFVRLFVESGQKVVLYGWHRAVYDIWMEQLRDFNPRLYTGTESPRQKDDAKEAFIQGDCGVLIISLRAGAGLDGLQTVCSTAVFGELDYSPGVHTQCIGRLDRDGQENPVMAYFLLSEDGSDPIIANIVGIKREQSESVLDPNAELIEKLEIDSGYIKTLAAEFLRQQGMTPVTAARQSADLREPVDAVA